MTFRRAWLLLSLVSACSGEELAARPDAGVDATTVDSTVTEVSPDAGDAEAVDAEAEADADADAADAAGDDTATDTTLLDTALPPDTADVATDTAPIPPPPVCTDDAGADADAEADADADAEAEAEAEADFGVSDSAPGPPTCASTRVRIVASNLTSGNFQSYEAAGVRILQALSPDIALMQEFKYPSGLRALVDEAFGKTFQYVVEPAPGAIPNGIVSRYPILESGEWDDPDVTDRDFVWARIDVPGPIDVWAVSVHLRTASATARQAEAQYLLAYVRAKVPAGAYLVIGGDLNTAVETEQALIDFSELLLVSTPFALDQAGNNKTNASRSKPYDWVLPNPHLSARMIPVRIGGQSFPSGLVFDTRVYAPLAEVPPALASDSAAANMQHMAVVRDFALGG